MTPDANRCHATLALTSCLTSHCEFNPSPSTFRWAGQPLKLVPPRAMAGQGALGPRIAGAALRGGAGRVWSCSVPNSKLAFRLLVGRRPRQSCQQSAGSEPAVTFIIGKQVWHPTGPTGNRAPTNARIPVLYTLSPAQPSGAEFWRPRSYAHARINQPTNQ